MMKYFGQRGTKAQRIKLAWKRQRFRSSLLITVFFEPRMSELQGKLPTAFLAFSMELLFVEQMVI